MKFTKEFLKDMVYGDNKYGEMIEQKIIDTSRWTIYYEMIFKINGKFYVTEYCKGATEYQTEEPYEWDEDVIDCDEVFPEEKTITVYER